MDRQMDKITNAKCNLLLHRV